MDILYNENKIGQTNNCASIKKLKLPPEINFNSNTDKVNDKIRGYLVYNSTDFTYHKNRSCAIEQEIKKIAIILESPHKDEFNFNENNKPPTPIAPAQGSTGTRLDNYIKKYCKNWKLNSDYNYEIYLMNSIQYQTSCYNTIIKNNPSYDLNFTLRNQVFKILWKSSANDLIQRIQQPDCSPDIIVNACTGGNSKYGLRNLVDKEIQKQLSSKYKLQINYFLEYHPSRWK